MCAGKPGSGLHHILNQDFILCDVCHLSKYHKYIVTNPITEHGTVGLLSAALDGCPFGHVLFGRCSVALLGQLVVFSPISFARGQSVVYAQASRLSKVSVAASIGLPPVAIFSGVALQSPASSLVCPFSHVPFGRWPPSGSWLSSTQ